jgi:hypothetical protein
MSVSLCYLYVSIYYLYKIFMLTKNIVIVTNSVVTFFLEIGVFASIVLFGIRERWLWPYTLLSMILLVFMMAFLWSMYAAPRSNRRLPNPYLSVFRFGVFFFSALLFYFSGYVYIGYVFFFISLCNQSMSYYFNV